MSKLLLAADCQVQDEVYVAMLDLIVLSARMCSFEEEAMYKKFW